MALVGIAMCRLHPARGRDAGTKDELRLDAGKGARASAEALLAAVRILGLRAPDVYIAEDGPPFSLVYASHSLEHAADLQPQIEMHHRGVVFVNDENRAAAVFGNLAFRLFGLPKIPFLPVLLQ